MSTSKVKLTARTPANSVPSRIPSTAHPTPSPLPCCATAAATTSVGGYFFNLGDAASGMHYKDQAREAAQEARNTELAIYALCTMSYYASWQGKAHAGIDLAAAAQSLATKTDDQLLQACIAVELGMAYAVDGQHKECMAAFEQALAGLALPADRRSPESPVYWFHEGLVASHQ
ncbi:MAG: hypothetical protein LC776_09250, partial [Acidobacteria bacterium]|nr:hypothetical protein [Acidobacteriota bacterium]